LGEMARWERRRVTVSTVYVAHPIRTSFYFEDWGKGKGDAREAHRIARWSAAAPVSMSLAPLSLLPLVEPVAPARKSDDLRFSLPISARKGWMSAGSPVAPHNVSIPRLPLR
jgi:hypothetical protein